MPSAWACETVPLVYPPAASQIADLQPELTWARKGDGDYRVQVVAVLPEAHVILSIDTIVQENRFKLPTAISSNFAAVKVLVSQGCSTLDAQDINAQGPVFIVNARATCALPLAALRQTGNTLTWAPVLAASQYTVRLFETEVSTSGLLHSRLIATSQTDGPRWIIPTDPAPSGFNSAGSPATSRVATVQALCNGLPGPIAQMVLKPAD